MLTFAERMELDEKHLKLQQRIAKALECDFRSQSPPPESPGLISKEAFDALSREDQNELLAKLATVGGKSLSWLRVRFGSSLWTDTYVRRRIAKAFYARDPQLFTTIRDKRQWGNAAFFDDLLSRAKEFHF